MSSKQENPENAFKSFEELEVPAEFSKIITDFIADIVTTFPEYAGLIKRWWSAEADDARKKREQTFVFRHCVKTVPERFFDILYKNSEMFADDSDLNTEFLPGIVFKQLWKCDISEATRETIWKYLQLILFSVIGSVHNSSEFGDSAKLFEAINEDELKAKLSETLDNMSSLFGNEGKEGEESSKESSSEGFSGEGTKESPFTPENMPNAEELHGHINNLMGGKLGKLAMELAEDTASELDLNMDENSNPKDVFQKLFKNPGKLMNMVKNIGGKIESKIKSGEIKESELMSEGMDLLNKMKSMPGMGDMSKIFSQMGIPGLDKNTKVNMGAMEAQMNKNMKMAKMKERMKAKSEQKAQPQASTPSSASQSKALSEEELIKIFSNGEKAQKTPRGAKPPAPQAPVSMQTPVPQVTAPVEKEPSSSKKKKSKK
jgi:hypothetical protein